MKNSARGDSSTDSELKAVEEASREASRTVEPCELCASVVSTSSQETQKNHPFHDTGDSSNVRVPLPPSSRIRAPSGNARFS